MQSGHWVRRKASRALLKVLAQLCRVVQTNAELHVMNEEIVKCAASIPGLGTRAGIRHVPLLRMRLLATRVQSSGMLAQFLMRYKEAGGKWAPFKTSACLSNKALPVVPVLVGMRLCDDLHSSSQTCPAPQHSICVLRQPHAPNTGQCWTQPRC